MVKIPGRKISNKPMTLALRVVWSCLEGPKALCEWGVCLKKTQRLTLESELDRQVRLYNHHTTFNSDLGSFQQSYQPPENY